MLNYDEYLQASNGTGEAVRSNVVVERPVGSTEINVDTVLNWPNKFIATSGVLNTGTGTFDPDTITVFFGHINGTYITIDEFAPGYSDRGNDANEIIVLKPTTSWADKLALRVSLPAGGALGQFLGKNSTNPGDASWKDLPSLSSWVADQGLSGAVNGINTVFTTASNFAAIIIYKNGITLHVGADYTITGANQVTFVTAPATGTRLTCTYVTSNSVLINGTSSINTDQTVSGTLNGVNLVFTTPSPYIGNTLEVFVNGVKQVRGIHFFETTPGSGIFTMSDAPLSTDVLSVNYQTALTVTGNADTIDGIHASATPTANTLFPLNANGKFTTSQIKLSSFSWLDTDSGTFSTISATMVDITGVTYSYTSGSTAETVFVWFQGMFYATAAVAHVGFMINGVDQVDECGYSNSPGAWSRFSKLYMFNIPANTTYVLKGRLRNETAGQTATFHRGGEYRSSIRGFAISQ